MYENIAVKAHRKMVMGRRVQQISKNISNMIPDGSMSVLDVGAGTGEMAQAVQSFRPELLFTGVDVYIRPKTFIPVVKYDGSILPFDDNSFDVVIIVDVLHHCKEPVSVLKECARVSRQYVVIKDHVSDSVLDSKILAFMDWVGNRAHGVVLPYNYLSSSDWSSAFDRAGISSVNQINKLNLYPMPLDIIFGSSLHCIHLLKKV
ncbi:MAG: methyltransferase domain-containing protein [Pseudomonadota bacterium]